MIFVGGGNTANMLAIWRVHGFDRILREAWEAGVLLTGWSAGMICWFEAGVTDSFGPQLEGMRDGLGFLAGQRVPALRRRGAAAAGLHAARRARASRPGSPPTTGSGCTSRGRSSSRSLTVRPGATAYRVGPEGEERLEARLVSAPRGRGHRRGMSFQEAALVQVVLEGVPLPAERAELIDYASRQEDSDRVLSLLLELPDREYGTLDEVGEALAPVQPSSEPDQPHEPSPRAAFRPAATRTPTRTPSRAGSVSTARAASGSSRAGIRFGGGRASRQPALT